MARPFEQTSLEQSDPDSPAAKRRKTEGGFTSQHSGYNSAEDDGDRLFDDAFHISTQQHSTQPTQIIGHTPNTFTPPRWSEIQVPASSPFRSSVNLPTPPSARTPQRPTAGMSSLMQPAGTLFRPPTAFLKPVQKVRREVIDLSDDDAPTYKGSSDDETSRNANIKPSAFIPRTSKPSVDTVDPLRGSQSGKAKFNNIINNSTHKPGIAPSKKDPIGTLYDPRKANTANSVIDLTKLADFPEIPMQKPRVSDTMASAYGGRPKPLIQSRPERAKPVTDIALDEITDYILKHKIQRLQAVFPSASVLLCRDALLTHKGNFDDAAGFLSTKELVNLWSDDELPDLPDIRKATTTAATTTKRGVDKVTSIKDRYGGAATAPPAKKAAASTSSQPEIIAEVKPKKRLMQGRKNPSSPVKAPSPKPASKLVEMINLDSDAENGYDSGVASQSEVDADLEGRVLKLMNKCQPGELADLSSITMDVAEKFLAQRPFRNLNAARSATDTSKTKSGKTSKRAPMGEKIVNVAMDMMKGYEAVDNLVTQCNKIAQPLRAEMSKWGFDVFGASKTGELELTSMNEDDDKESVRDSGIGTPNSVSASQNGDQGEEEIRTMNRRDRLAKFLQKPSNMSETTVLKDYQVVGLNWLTLLYKQKLSCILADEMGLGKTCQVIAFLSHLATIGIPGPHLVIVPGSTLENWLREFQQFSPGLVVTPYHGTQGEREEMAENILERGNEINVVVTTYDMASKDRDNRFMRHLNPNVCVYDEGHLLKNPESKRYRGLVRIPAQFRLLLTGTPLQNNLQELAALLAFILPHVFRENSEELAFIFKHRAKTTDSDHSALLSTQRINRARQMLAPFVLRRKKAQVLKHLPAKVCRVEYCDLHPSQQEIYDGHKEQALEKARLRIEGGKIPKSTENNPLMQLRKAAIHPQLFRRYFTDKKVEKMASILQKNYPEFNPNGPKGDGTGYKTEFLLQEMKSMSDFILHKWCSDYPAIAKFDVNADSCYDSGKIKTMMELVEQYKTNGDRVLIFSQFSMVLDILEEVLNGNNVYFTRIDGNTNINARQTLIDQFRDDETITVFLLTTKAGGTGLNLMMANKVIIFDGSFNPQDDVQAENRAHRVGQQRDVEVVRLVTKNTIEEPILRLGQSKLALDRGVAGDEAKVEEEGEADVARMLLEDNDKSKDTTKVDEAIEGKGKDRQASGSAAAARNSVSAATGGRKRSLFLSNV